MDYCSNLERYVDCSDDAGASVRRDEQQRDIQRQNDRITHHSYQNNRPEPHTYPNLNHFYKSRPDTSRAKPDKKDKRRGQRYAVGSNVTGSCSNSGHRHHGPKKGSFFRRPLTSVESLPYPAEGVEVVYTNDPADAESWLKNKVIDSEASALGLDIEWKPQFVSKKNGGTENKTAVIQLAVEDSSLVLHIFHMKSFPKSLSAVLANKNVLKVGSGIKGDVMKLIKDTGMLCDGRVDTQDYAKALGIASGVGLKRLSKKVLNIDLNKPKRISLSNWEKFPLRKDQIAYAALDAWISLKLYIKLKDQLATKNDGASKPEVIEVGYDKPEMARTYKCQACNETVATKGKLFRHKIRCVLFNSIHFKDALKGNDQHNPRGDLSDTFTMQESSSKVGCSSDKTISDGSASSGFSEESKKDDIIICPVSQCRVQCQGQDDFKEHIRVANHACCRECGRIFRSKVSRFHRKQHFTEKNSLPEVEIKE